MEEIRDLIDAAQHYLVQAESFLEQALNRSEEEEYEDKGESELSQSLSDEKGRVSDVEMNLGRLKREHLS